MCIALRPDKASEANTRKSECLARIKEHRQNVSLV
jgi:hypothetical protein